MTASEREHRILQSAEVLTVGLPFCVFKLLTGIVAVRSAPFVSVGWLLIGLAFVDLCFNLVNLGSLTIRRRRAAGVCLTDFLLRRFEPGRTYKELGIAFDVLLSFALVAIVIGAGLLPHMPVWALTVWNVAVVLNVLGAGIARVHAALTPRGSSPSARDS